MKWAQRSRGSLVDRERQVSKELIAAGKWHKKKQPYHGAIKGSKDLITNLEAQEMSAGQRVEGRIDT